MNFRRLLISGIAAGLISGLTGYWLGQRTETARRVSPSEGGAGPTFDEAFPAWKPLTLPGIRPTDHSVFESSVAELTKSGLTQNLARWLALSAFARQDLRASLETAQALNLTEMWAAIAAEADPSGGFAILRDTPALDGDSDAWFVQGKGAMPAFFATLGQRDPALALEFLEQLPEHRRWNSQYALFQTWAARDPLEALAQAKTLEPYRRQRVALNAALQGWSGTDRSGMMEWVERQQDPKLLRSAFYSLWSINGLRSPESLLDILDRHPEAAAPHVQFQMANALAQKGTEGWKAIARMKAGPMRSSLTRGFSSLFAQRDPAAAWAFAQELPAEERASFLRSGLSELAATYPAEMANFLGKSGSLASSAAENLLHGWEKTDPAAALTWATHNLQGNLLATRSGNLLAALSEKNPSAALEAWATLPAGLRMRSLPDLAQRQGTANPETALAWTAGLPNNERRRALENIFEGWGKSDPHAAATALLTMPGEKLGGAVETVASGLAEKNLAEAESWVAKLPPAQAEPATEAFFKQWAGSDIVAASERLDTLPPGNLRDRSIVGFAYTSSPYDPDSAAVWAASIQDAELRKRAIRNLAYNWREKDRSAARAFAGTISEPELRENILRIVNERN